MRPWVKAQIYQKDRKGEREGGRNREREGGSVVRIEGKEERKRKQMKIKEKETKLEFKCIKISTRQKSSQVYCKIKP